MAGQGASSEATSSGRGFFTCNELLMGFTSSIFDNLGHFFMMRPTMLSHTGIRGKTCESVHRELAI